MHERTFIQILAQILTQSHTYTCEALGSEGTADIVVPWSLQSPGDLLIYQGQLQMLTLSIQSITVMIKYLGKQPCHLKKETFISLVRLKIYLNNMVVLDMGNVPFYLLLTDITMHGLILEV